MGQVLVAQWIEHPAGVLEAMGSIPVGDSDFFVVPCSCHVDQFTFHISLPSSKLPTLFTYQRSSCPQICPVFDELCECVVRIFQLTLEKYGTCNNGREFIRVLFWWLHKRLSRHFHSGLSRSAGAVMHESDGWRWSMLLRRPAARN